LHSASNALNGPGIVETETSLSCVGGGTIRAHNRC